MARCYSVGDYLRLSVILLVVELVFVHLDGFSSSWDTSACKMWLLMLTSLIPLFF